MSSQQTGFLSIPRDTARAARAVFGPTNFYIVVGEQLANILDSIQIGDSSDAGMMAAMPPLVTFFQFLESLTDAQAMDAIRMRLDWKYALHLPVHPRAFRESALCEFRQRILMEPPYQREFQALIDRLVTLSPPLNNKFQDFKNLELAFSVCAVNRRALIQGAMGEALAALACKYPVWLQKMALPHWYGRYNRAAPKFYPASSLRQQELSLQQIDADIHHLLEEVRRAGSHEIRKLPEVQVLDQIWMRQFEKSDQVLNDKRTFLKLNDCDSCIHKERSNPGGKYQ